MAAERNEHAAEGCAPHVRLRGAAAGWCRGKALATRFRMCTKAGMLNAGRQAVLAHLTVRADVGTYNVEVDLSLERLVKGSS